MKAGFGTCFLYCEKGEIMKNNIIYLIDYENLSKRISEIIGEDIEIKEENAKELLKKLYYTRVIKMMKLNLALTHIDEIEEEHIEMLEFETDRETIYHTTAILFNVFNREYQLIEQENIKLFLDLICNNEIQQILKEEIPVLIEISNYIEEKKCKTIDVSDIIENIFDKFFFIDIFNIDEDKFFEEINKELEEFYKEGKIDTCLKF